MLRSTFDNAVNYFWREYTSVETNRRENWNKRYPQFEIKDNKMTFEYGLGTIKVQFYPFCDSVRSISGGLWLLRYSID